MADEAKGEGLGKTLWKTLKKDNSSLFWRCKPENNINGFYFGNSEGCYKSKQWNVFWYGIKDFKEIESCVEFALHKAATLNK